MTLSKLQNQVVTLPATSTFTSDADITARALKNSAMTVPDFKTTLNIVGIPTSVGLRIAQVGDLTGSVNLDNSGQLHIHGTANVNVSITSLDGIGVGTCTTQTPVVLPLDFDGPVSALGSGGLVFTGTTTFPSIKGCLTSSIITVLMSGPGQGYKFAVTPPAPAQY